MLQAVVLSKREQAIEISKREQAIELAKHSNHDILNVGNTYDEDQKKVKTKKKLSREDAIEIAHDHMVECTEDIQHLIAEFKGVILFVKCIIAFQIILLIVATICRR